MKRLFALSRLSYLTSVAILYSGFDSFFNAFYRLKSMPQEDFSVFFESKELWAAQIEAVR